MKIGSNNILNLTKRLMRFKTDPDQATELQSALTLIESELREYTIEKFVSNGYSSILVYKEKTRPKNFKIILNGHLDVIPGNPKNYSPRVEGDRLYGVGSMDMKGSVAAMVTAFKANVTKVSYPLALQIVTEEEIGGFWGTKYQIEQGVKADFVIAGESTNFDIVNQAKGVLWLKVSCRGTAAHGAYPWAGENAIWKMQRFLAKLEDEFPIPKKKSWVTTVNFSRIETTNVSFNRVPEDCTVCLDVRFVPEDKKVILPKIKKLLPKDFTLEVIANEAELDVSKDNPYLVLLKKATSNVTGRKVKLYGAQGSSDARHYTASGMSGVEFGPIGANIGTDQEYVEISSLKTFADILEKFLLSLN
jgi:succinyl-diaminopimelate desuccinylase